MKGWLPELLTILIVTAEKSDNFDRISTTAFDYYAQSKLSRRFTPTCPLINDISLRERKSQPVSRIFSLSPCICMYTWGKVFSVRFEVRATIIEVRFAIEYYTENIHSVRSDFNFRSIKRSISSRRYLPMCRIFKIEAIISYNTIIF